MNMKKTKNRQSILFSLATFCFSGFFFRFNLQVIIGLGHSMAIKVTDRSR